MAHPRIEEVEDSDADMSDPSEADIDDFKDADIMRRVGTKQQAPSTAKSSSVSRPSGGAPAPPGARSHIMSPADLPFRPAGGAGHQPPPKYSHFQVLYPVYFDSSRTRAQGRRVARSEAVPNPLAHEIATACVRLTLMHVLEPGKTHPKDWANPGRVRVRLRGEGGAPATGGGAAKIENKHHLYRLVAAHLRAHPPREHGAELLPGPGMGVAMLVPDASKPWPRPAVPRGWKMAELLPCYSPAVTGGGVSENMFRDMMKDMQAAGGQPDLASTMSAALGGGSGGAGGAEEKKPKKDKKGKGK